ncbi:uncharacterized protein LOC116300609 [Actinia tenebrosa]|uniref:arylamine N-acetyltransferase n=1 Tax=Actinia tenebrosa TaxID=6105 RepID=A0A6P8IF74_ACTTE|nr:uncharacterized protein LOC116300609 [Actinia tenebrosa]
MSQLLKQTFIKDYLKRLQYSGPVLPNLETLNTLHRLHILNIPFENLNNLLQEEYLCTKEGLYEKIVLEHRGGLCHELNTSFAFLLKDIGFSLIRVEAKVYCNYMKSWAPLPTHQLLIVYLGEEIWIVDVGFGEGFAVPLRFVEDEIQDAENANYRIKKDLDEAGQKWFIIESSSRNVVALHLSNEAEKSEDCEWQYIYKFNLTPRSIQHFSNARNMTLKSPSSTFNQGLVCTLLRPWGRITISRYKLIKKYVKNKEISRKEVKMLENQEEVMSVLESEFGIKIQHFETPLKLA